MSVKTLFPLLKQTKPVKVKLSDDVTWEIGVEPAFGAITNPEYLRGFDVRHAELISKLLAFPRENDISFRQEIDISYGKLLAISNMEMSANNLNTMKNIIADLCSIWVKISCQENCCILRVLSVSVDEQNGILKNLGFSHAFLDHIEDMNLFLK